MLKSSKFKKNLKYKVLPKFPMITEELTQDSADLKSTETQTMSIINPYVTIDYKR